MNLPTDTKKGLRCTRGARRLVDNSRNFALVLTGAGLILSAACRSEAPPSDEKPIARANSAAASSGAAKVRAQAKAPRSAPEKPKTLLRWQESAYGVSVFVEGSTVLVLTPTSVIRLQDGAPPYKNPVPIGAARALMGDSIIYWRDGAVRAISKTGSEPRSRGLLENRPQALVASEKRWAWLDRGDDGTMSLQTLDGNTPRVLHQSEERIATVAMQGDHAFFVESQSDGAWRIGRVSISDKATVLSRVHRGRTPSMLVAAPDGIYFYDGPTRSVRRSSLDLEREAVFAENVICSPLAVSDRVVCGHVEGVFEIPGKGRAPRVVSRETGGPIVAVAADEKRAVWVVDTAENRFTVRSVALTRP